MIHFDMPPQKSNIIKVLGFGGGGGNAVNHMYLQTIQNVDFIVCNTDAQALAISPVPNKIQLGPNLTSGLGAGANPNIGKQATEESLDEIRKMLEVNTKMAFITAGMGGGTGTGGAPTVARICKEMGILTVGIVTTPFSFEGPKRMAQAKAGVDELKNHVDTLLVISNDKLRHQFGNLKMKEAFSKADDVLTTAARCITDVINTTGEINVDFSDVCTVMRDGGVAILGSAQVSGENRAIEAIEAAANSPLLNDSDISGAKWILLNITSAEGDYEYSMDEVEIIQNYLLSQTGSDTDIILGMGYDNSLGEKIGITLIATGFNQKDPFVRPEPKKEAAAPPILMTLGVPGEENKMDEQVFVPVRTETTATQSMVPLLRETEPEPASYNTYPTLAYDGSMEPVIEQAAVENAQQEVIELSLEITESVIDTSITAESQAEEPVKEKEDLKVAELIAFLNKPSSVYHADPFVQMEEMQEEPKPVELQQPVQSSLQFEFHEEEDGIGHGLVLTMEEQEPGPAPARQIQVIDDNQGSNGGDLSEEEMQKRRAQERMARLRNLSFNPLNIDHNSEFDETPAYLRRNLELHNALANVEDFYSRATVRTDDDNQATINTVNTFLHGEKPD